MPLNVNPISPLAAVLAGRAQSTLQPASTASAPSAAGPMLAPALAPALAAKPELTSAGGETTQELFQGLRQGVKNYRNGLVEMAHYAYRLWENDDWQALNFADESACFTSLGLTEKAWTSYLILGERLSSLTLEEMRGLTAASARLLSKIPHKVWDEFAWVDEARFLPAKDFALLVAERTQAIRRSQGFTEPRASLSLQVPVTLHGQFEQRINSLRQREKLATSADVLDFALRAAEKDPALAGEIWKLDQAFQELVRFLDAPDATAHKDSVHKLELKIQRTLGGLKRNVAATNLQAKVAGNSLAADSALPPA